MSRHAHCPHPVGKIGLRSSDCISWSGSCQQEGSVATVQTKLALAPFAGPGNWNGYMGVSRTRPTHHLTTALRLVSGGHSSGRGAVISSSRGQLCPGLRSTRMHTRTCTHTHPGVPRMKGQQALPHLDTHDLGPGKEGVDRGVTVVSLAQNLKESVKSGKISGKGMWD